MNSRPRHLLARHGPVTITSCPGIGCIHLSVGPVTVHVSKSTLMALGIAVQESLARLAIRSHDAAQLALAPAIEDC